MPNGEAYRRIANHETSTVYSSMAVKNNSEVSLDARENGGIKVGNIATCLHG